MSTTNHIRLTQLNPAIAAECERDHRPDDARHPYGAPQAAKVDPYTRRRNICPVCHTARATGTGVCLC